MVAVATSAQNIATSISHGNLVVVPLSARVEIKGKAVRGHVLIGQVLEGRIPPIVGELV